MNLSVEKFKCLHQHHFSHYTKINIASFVNMVMNIHIPGNILANWVTTKLSGQTVHWS